MFTRDELEIVRDFAQTHDLFVFTDEIYEYFVYGAAPHVSPATLPGLAERTIMIGGYSKTFSITGWRIGYCVAAAPWARMIGYMNDLVYVCAPAPLQIGVAEGIRRLPLSLYQDLGREHQAKRDQICAALTGAGLTPCVPEGACYVLADISALGARSAKEGAMELLRRTGVASVPGGSFFADATRDRFVRFCYAKVQDQLDLACAALGRLQNGPP